MVSLYIFQSPVWDWKSEEEKVVENAGMTSDDFNDCSDFNYILLFYFVLILIFARPIFSVTPNHHNLLNYRVYILN